MKHLQGNSKTDVEEVPKEFVLSFFFTILIPLFNGGSLSRAGVKLIPNSVSILLRNSKRVNFFDRKGKGVYVLMVELSFLDLILKNPPAYYLSIFQIRKMWLRYSKSL